MEGIQEPTVRGHTLKSPADWQLFKTFVQAYARKRYAMNILDGTEDRPEGTSKAELRDFDQRSGDLFFYILSNIGPEYVSSIQGSDTSTCNSAWLKLCDMFEGHKHISISLALRNFTTFPSAGLSAGKFLADLHLLSQTLKLVITKDMKINDFIDILEVQTILNGLPEEFDALKTTLRAQVDMLTLRDIRDRVISEDAAIRQQHKPSSISASALQVADHIRKRCTNHGCPHPTGHLSSECWFKFPDLKAKFSSKRRQSRETSQHSSAKSANQSDLVTSYVWTVKDSAHQAYYTTPDCVSKGITRAFNMDSGCTSTIVNSLDGLVNIAPDESLSFSLADRSIVKSEGTGYATGNGKYLKCSIVREFQENLLSIPQLYNDDIATVFHPRHGIMIAKASDMIVNCSHALGRGRYINGTFMMDICISNENSVNISQGSIASSPAAAEQARHLGIPMAIAPVVDISTKAILWYKRLGYTSPQRIVEAIKRNLIRGVNLPKDISTSHFKIDQVEASQLAKSKAQPHRNLNMKKHSTRPYEMLHIDYKHVGISSWGGAIGLLTTTQEKFMLFLCHPKFISYINSKNS